MTVSEIERALIKTYRSKIYNKFIKAVVDFNLFSEGDCIGVCISGGKDSFVLAKLIQEYVRHGKVKIDAKYLVMDPGYSQENLELLKKNAEILGIPIQIKKSNVFEVAKAYGGEKPCYLCARMRRGFLYEFAKENGCNKIALAHHLNDVIETTLLNIFYSSTFKTMLPKLKSTNFENMELIRPLYYIEEKHIINFINYCNITPLNCGCDVASGKLDSKRREIKNLIKQLKEINPDIEKNIFNSANNVNLNCILGWTKDDKKYTFLDEYETNISSDFE